MTTIKTQVVVLGAGPGGYTAAFRAADLGLKVVLVEQYEQLGGVCLNVGCIPSKTLLHVAKVMAEAKHLSIAGIDFPAPTINLDKLRAFKDQVVNKLASGIKMLSKGRAVEVVHGYGKFTSAHSLEVVGKDTTVIEFEHAIIAVGSKPVALPSLPVDPRIINSTGALKLASIPKNMLVIGGGIIGMEMATVYAALGSKITVVELGPNILMGVDKDITAPFIKRISKDITILTNTSITAVKAEAKHLVVQFSGDKAPSEQHFDVILQAVGRVPNGNLIAAEKAGVVVDNKGFIAVDKQLRTNVAHIFAIGDVTGNPMLAHKALPEGKIAAEVIAGKKHYFQAKCIPNVAYTDPEIAWVGVSEDEAKARGINYGKGVFPWAASGRAISQGREEGLTKVIIDKDKNKIIGGAIIGVNAGELISEISLAIEMGADPEDVALTIHPHPTLSESVALAIEVFEGTITDLPNKK